MCLLSGGRQLGGHIANVTADILGGGEEAAIVLLRLEEHNVEFGEEEKEEGDESAEADAETQANDILIGVVVDGDEGNPDDEGRVHGKADELGLVEVLGHIARLDGVQCAEAYEHKVKAQRSRDAWLRLLVGW